MMPMFLVKTLLVIVFFLWEMAQDHENCADFRDQSNYG